jgi:hypothetical protein
VSTDEGTASPPRRLPVATEKPCNECPWRRNAEPGFLGPHTAQEWIFFAHSGGPIGCHKTIQVDGDWGQRGLRQCAGAAIFRANDQVLPARPDVATAAPNTAAVFSDCAEFLAHHGA